jgi:hypothetical protein
MPSASKAQQRLMGQAYAYKKGELKSSEVSAEIKELADNMTLKQLKDFASTKHAGLPETVDEAFIGPFVFNDSMSDEELLGMYNGALDGYANYAKGMHYAKSDYKKAYQEIEKILKKRGVAVDENLAPGSLNGMGPVMLPTSSTNGSGDVPAGQGDAKQEYKKKRKKMKHLKNFESFVNESAKLADDVSNALNVFNNLAVVLYDNKDKRHKIIGKSIEAIDRSISKREISNLKESVNEEYIELAGFSTYSDDLIDEFKEWYKATADNWEDFKNDMAEDSVDEAAKNAQMEILAYLSNEMNSIIKDRKFKVRMDLK